MKISRHSAELQRIPRLALQTLELSPNLKSEAVKKELAAFETAILKRLLLYKQTDLVLAVYEVEKKPAGV